MNQILVASECVSLLQVSTLAIKDKFIVDDSLTKKPSEIYTIGDSSLFVVTYDDEQSYAFLTIKTIEDLGEEKILKVRKCNTGHQMHSIAAPKRDSEDLAIGFASGHVRMVNIKSSKFVKSFAPEITNNAVWSLDFNCEDKYLASVLDNGVTELINVSSHVVSDRIKSDKATTSARFHASRPFRLAMASRLGMVSMYDIVSKKFVLKTPNAHQSIVKDLAFDVNSPDLIFSGSYDTTVKVYDMRNKYTSASIKCEAPVHSILTGGQQVIAGTLASTLEVFDLRNTKEPLARKNLGTGQIKKLAWAPTKSESLGSFETSSVTSVGNRKTGSFGLPLENSLDQLKIKSRPSDLEPRKASCLKPKRSGENRLSADFGSAKSFIDSIEAFESPLPEPASLKHRKSVKIFEETPKSIYRSRVSQKLQSQEAIVEEGEREAEGENKENLEILAEAAQGENKEEPGSALPDCLAKRILEKLESMDRKMDGFKTELDQLKSNLEDVRNDTRFEIHQARSNVFEQNFNLFRMTNEHRETVEAALTLIVDLVGPHSPVLNNLAKSISANTRNSQ